MSTITKVLADNIRRLRKEKGMTQIELAEAIEVSLASIQNYESERIWPSIETILAISKAFKIDDTKLFRDPNYIEPTSLALKEFGRLLGHAHPEQIKHALQILGIGQPDESPSSGNSEDRPSKS